MPVTAGDKFGPYEIVSAIGKGGMGDVWKAHDTRLHRDVAIKFCAHQFSDRFLREARAIAALNHSNICTLFDIGPDYLVMEYIAGAPPRGPLAPEEVVRLGLGIAAALEAAHAKGIVHRDLKPANVLVTRTDVKLLDFGLALVDENADAGAAGTLTALTLPGTVMGTVAYMSPEQARGAELDGRSDLFSCGAVLYEMATGVPPFRGESAAVIFDALLNKTPPSVRERNPEIPVELERVIARLLEKDRETRYQSAADVRADLKRVERNSSAIGAIAPAATEAKTRRLPRYSIAAAVAVLMVASSVFWLQRVQAKPFTDHDVLVLADFTNTTGDTELDGALREALAIALEKSPFLKVMDTQEVNQTLKLMGRPANQPITNDVAHEVCVREGQKATMEGSIARFGKAYQIGLRAINCQTGATLAREQAEAKDEENVPRAVAKAAKGMRARLGESLSSIEKPGKSLDEDVSTTSLEALKAFRLGFDLIAQDLSREAIPQLQRATEMDQNFASAWLFLGIAYGNIGDAVRSAENLTKAFALKDRAGEYERLLISGEYYSNVTREVDKAANAYQADALAYPRFAGPHNGLMVLYQARGDYENALREAQEESRLEPRILGFRPALMQAYMNLDRFGEAKAVAEGAFSQKLDDWGLHVLLLTIAQMEGDLPGQDKEIAWFAGKPKEYVSVRYQATNAIVHGQRRQAREFYQQGIELARRQGITDVVRFSPSPAFIDAMMGDCAAAQREKSVPVMRYCLDPSAVRVVEELIAKSPSPNLYGSDVLYFLGLVSLHRGKDAEAAALFQKVLDHKGRNWGWYYSVSSLGLGRAAALTGDTSRAKKAYENFFALWKEADPDIPTLIAARKEYAALH